MTEYNTLSIMCNLQLNKSNLGIKDGTEVSFKISSNVVDDFNDENNFLHKKDLQMIHQLI